MIRVATLIIRYSTVQTFRGKKTLYFCSAKRLGVEGKQGPIEIHVGLERIDNQDVFPSILYVVVVIEYVVVK